MKTGSIELETLYQFVRQYPDVPHRSNDTEVYHLYRELVRDLISTVPQEPGWYAWFQKANASNPVYIGQSSKRKTSSLQARLEEELLEEYVAFWSSVDERAAETLTAKYGGRYFNNQIRALRKKGSDSIVWVAQQGCKQGTLDVVENKLIWELKPTANEDRRDYSDIELPLYVNVRRSMESAFKASG